MDISVVVVTGVIVTVVVVILGSFRFFRFDRRRRILSSRTTGQYDYDGEGGKAGEKQVEFRHLVGSF